MELQRIPVEAIEMVWPMIEADVERAVSRNGGRFTVDGLKARVENDDWQLFLVWDKDERSHKAIVMTNVYREMNGELVASIPFVSGRRAEEWIDLLPVLEGWAEKVGAHRIETWARKGWARRLKDYKLTHVLLEKPLNGHQHKQANATDATTD